jgi:ABC-type multidrug transport system ATPase subunit
MQSSLDKRSSRLQQYYSSSRVVDGKVVLSWSNINYSMKEKDSKQSTFFKNAYKVKNILKSISGSAESGQLLAIMGPTGCGKTSLLNVLASRVSSGGSSNARLDGNVYVNGFARDDILFRKLSAYVLQDDKLYPHLTVFETLLLAAHFYMADDMTMEAKQELVNDVISELGLSKVRNTIIGDEKVRGKNNL